MSIFAMILLIAVMGIFAYICNMYEPKESDQSWADPEKVED